MQTINLVNVKLDIGTSSEVKEIFTQAFEKSCATKIMFLNAYALTLAQKDEEFKSAVNNADLLINDGVGIEKLVKKMGYEVPENLNGTDLIPKLVEIAADMDKNVFLLGTRQEMVSAATAEVNKKYGKQVVTEYNNGFFSEDELDKIIEKINASGAEILILGMGMPIQEKWMYRNIDKLVGVKVVIAGGAIIDYMSGRLKRSPEIWVKLKLEWLYRMLREPKRLIKRNWATIKVLIKFYFKVGKKK